MKAGIAPLIGKHYGTSIYIEDPKNGVESARITVWETADFVPSDREVKNSLGITKQEWLDNVLVDGSIGGPERAKDLLPMDDHFESQWQYDLCQTIVDAINSKAQD